MIKKITFVIIRLDLLTGSTLAEILAHITDVEKNNKGSYDAKY